MTTGVEVACGSGGGGDAGRSARRLLRAALAAALLLYLTLALAVTWTRAPIDDDAFYASAAYNLYAHGFTGTTIYETAGLPFPGVERRTYTYPPLHMVVQAGWYRLTGFGIHQMRLNSVLWGLLLLAAWFVLARELTGNIAIAALTVLLLAADYTVAMTASLGRMSMMSAALEFGAFACYLSWRKTDLRRALLLSNTCAMLAGLAHPLAGVLAVVNLIFLVLWFDRRSLRWRHAGYVLAPYLVGAIGWGLYIARDPRMFVAQFTASSVQGRRLNGLFNPVAAIVSEVRDRYFGYYGLTATKKDPRILLFISYVIGAASALAVPSLRRGPGFRVLAGLTVISFVSVALIEGTKQRVYMIHTIPFLVMWAAWFLYWLWSRGRARRALAVALASLFVLLHVAAVGYRVILNPYARQYMPVVEYVRPTARTGALVMGPAPLLFELGFDTNLIFDPELGAGSGKVPALIVLDDQSRLTMASRWEDDPARGAQARAVLERYHLIFQHGEYEVYAPKPSP